MESFLASRATVTKLGSTVKNLAGGVFTPMGEKPKAPAPPPPEAAAPPAGEGAAAPHAGATLGDKAGHAVRVEVIRENGAVERLVVHCQCGERIELDCLY